MRVISLRWFSHGVPALGLLSLGLVACAWAANPPAAPEAKPATGNSVASAGLHSSAEFDRVVLPFLNKHCIRCHGDKEQAGEMRLDTLSRNFAGGGSASHWGDVLERISAGEMPPEKEPQPTADEATRVVEWIAGGLKEGEAARHAKRERVTFHKLTREEYANTVHDLLGVRYDATDPTGLPEDPEYHGFERIGSVLSLSPSHVEKYFAAAEAALAEAFPSKPVEPFIKYRDGIDLRNGNRPELEAQGLADKVRVELWPGADLAGRVGPGVALPAAGEYRVRIKLSGLKPAGGRAPHLAFYVVNLDRMLFEQDIVAAEDAPIVVEFTAHLPAGNHNYRLSNEAPGPSNLPRSGRADPRIPFFSVKQGRRPWQVKLTDDNLEPIMPFLIVDSVQWEGPLGAGEQTEAQRKYMPQVALDPTMVEPKTHKPSSINPKLPPAKPAELTAHHLNLVRDSLTRFAERAFRRAVSAGEVDRFVKLVQSEMVSGEKFEDAMKTSLLAVMCSKDFLYVVEGSADRASPKLNDWELASRLSYFLWSTMPDDALFASARDGTLHRPEVLRSHVTRMLADPKAKRFGQAFPKQWLQLRLVGMFPPDKKLYPAYDDYLQKSMIAETTAYFTEVLEKNLSLREFLVSDWTMMNARLAEHYELTGVDEDRMHRIQLKPENHRGGLLTQAAVLTLTSDGTRHRPVHRGKWVSESILGKSPPPPPANVKPIEPSEATAPKATLRAKLAAHTSDANCAACHKKIDPLGFAFDNYDAIGRWRTEETVSDGVGSNPPIDATGILPDGRKFGDVEQFKQLLLADVDKFNAAFVEKLATFALRRTLTVDDRAALAALAKQGKAADYRLQEIVAALVVSDLFAQR